MKIKILSPIIFLALIFLNTNSVFAQLTGVKFVPGDYATVTLAVAAVNTAGVGPGGVTFNVAANYTETITAVISLTATGTSANPIIFRKDPATSGANPLITAYTGGTATPSSAGAQDGIWRLSGSDYTTIDGIDIRDNPANTTNPSTMEYGFALYKQSASNGCQYVTIQNCTITLNRINNASPANPMTDGSAGIYMLSCNALDATQVFGATAGGAHSNNKFYSNTIQNCNIGISLIGAAVTAPYTLADFNNDIGGSTAATGNTIINFGGGAGATNPAAGVRTLSQYGLNVSYNTINNNNGGGVNHPVQVRGIFINTAAGASATINNNTVTVNGGGTATNITAIENGAGSTAAGNTITINNNNVINGTFATATAYVSFYGIYNTGAPATLNINNNTIAGNSFSSPSGTYFAIYNYGAVTTAININGNNIGNSILGAFSFTAANSASQTFIYNRLGSPSAALSISNNNFQGINYAVQGTGPCNFITNDAATLSQAINNNTFTALNINTIHNVNFITNNVISQSTGVQNINGNAIVTSFNKPGSGGTVTLFTTAASSVTGSVSNNNNNNFSNITLGGAAITMAGWVNIDAGNSIKTIQNNTFSNWNVTGSTNVMNINLTGTNNFVTGNTINNIVGTGTIVGITTAVGNNKIYGNTINTVATTGTSITGILITGGTTQNIYNNKIYDIQLNNAGGLAAGITVSGSTVVTANIYNNLIGDIRAPIINQGTDATRGINIVSTSANSTNNVYYNTVYLNASSAAPNFSSTGIFHTVSGVATTAKLNLRNNSITNLSVPNGSGITAAYRRSANTFTNYAPTSNNNLFYAGAPAANRLIYYDGTNQSQRMINYKAVVTPRDNVSVTEELTTKFLSIAGASPSYLHIDNTKATVIESGGANITNYTTDYDNQSRQGNSGYTGTGTAPDIGADEVDAVPSPSLIGTYNVGAGQFYTSLTNAGGLFAAINSVGLSGNMVVNIVSDITEDGTNALYDWAETGLGNYTLTVQPDGPATRILSGDILIGMIRLNGAKRVTFDGSNGAANNYLTFRNTNASGTNGTAFTFLNGASFNTIKYCNIEAYTNATNGIIYFSASTVASGNSNNTISNCAINATVNSLTGSVCIYAAGTAGSENVANSIVNNTIFNYRDRGLDINAIGSKSWLISNNSFYNGDVTAAINYAASSTLHGIRIGGGTGYTITNNAIGGNAPLAAGTAASYSSTVGAVSFQGILTTTTAVMPISIIKGNKIANIAVSSVPLGGTSNVFIGIETNGFATNIGGLLATDANVVGSNTANGSIVITTTTTNGGWSSIAKGINCNSAGGVVLGNQVGGIDITNSGSAPAPTVFTGISVNNAVAPPQINNNIIGSTGVGAAANSIRITAGSSSAAATLTGISIGAAVASPVQINANTIQNVSYLYTVATGSFTGIFNSSAAAAVVSITNNIITGNTTNAGTGGFYGIYNNAGSATVNINTNTITSNTSTATGNGFMYGINTGSTGASAITINNNIFANNVTGALGAGSLVAAIFNGAPLTSLSISSNSIYSNVTATVNLFYAIFNYGAVTGAININSNNLGTSSLPVVTYSAVVPGNTQIFIFNQGGTATARLSISNNNINNTVFPPASVCNVFFISNTAPTLSQAINGNTFNNLNLNTSGGVTFISNSVPLSSSGTQNINNNSIVGTFTKAAGSAVTLYTSTATSVSGSTITNNNNNFSNITLTGATSTNGWASADAGSATKTIQNNTFTNWTAGSGNVSVMTINNTSTNNSTTANTISNITGAANVTGIVSAGNDNIYLNTINTLLSTSNGQTVTGMSITGGTTKNIYRNKIYGLQSSSTTYCMVNGIEVSGSAVVGANIYNNLIGDLRAPFASNLDLIRGISVVSSTPNSAINVYYNTIFLNATSSGTDFGTAGIYHITNGTATTATLNLINNIVCNNSVAKGNGLTAAYRRSNPTLANYGSSSNNNLFYAGTPSATQLLFYDGTNKDQALSTYKTRVSTRDASSVSQDQAPKFFSTAGSSPIFLHVDSTLGSVIFNAGATISGFTDDYDGQVRAGSAGYTGLATNPCIGADESFGLETMPPTITYTLLTNTTAVANRAVTGVTITDASGVNTLAGTKPRIYYKRLADANAYLDNTSSTNGWKFAEASNAATPFSFTIDYSLLNGSATFSAGAIQYFVVAQDVATVANVGINSGTFAATPASVALTNAAFPITGTINQYNIAFAGVYNVGTKEVYNSLTGASGVFAAVNSAGLQGNATFIITSDLLEDGTNALNQWTETGGSGYTVTITPDAASQRTIYGDVAAGLIRFNGSSRVKVDGSFGGSGSYISFKNTNAGGTTGTAFTFINGATNNTIKYCDVQAASNATNGVILFGASSGATGNSSNHIENCTITGAIGGNVGKAAIYSAGTAGNENITDTIINNNIYGYTDRGLDIAATGSSAWAIVNNSFYNGNNSGTINYPAAAALHGIRVLGGAGYAITNNYIGSNDVLASGTNAVYSSTAGNVSYQGILLTTTSGTPASNIKGNTIAGITVSSNPTAPGSLVFTGIETNGAGINIGGSTAGEGNVVGSASSNGAISITTATAATANTSLINGINCASTGGSVINNTVAGIDINNIGSLPAAAAFVGLTINSITAPTLVTGNIIGSAATNNSIRVLPGSTATATSLTGIAVGSAVTTAVTISGNVIQRISQLSTTSSGSFTGINNAATSGTITITSDTIQNISSAANASAGSAAYTGISASETAVISNNIVNNIVHASTGVNAQVVGINVSGAFVHAITGNAVSYLSTPSARASASIETGSPAAATIAGIINSATLAGQIISGNILHDFNATNTAAANTMVAGIGITATASGNIFNNRLAIFTNNATGSSAGICGVAAAGGSFNLYNNSIKIDNGTNLNGIKIYGIVHAAGNNWNYNYNTVSIGGNATGTALRSAAFIRPVTGALSLVDNIFINNRIGTGANYAISNIVSPATAAWPSTTSNYNNLFSNNSATVAEWGAANNQTFAQWKTASGGDANAVSTNVSFLASLYDLQPDSTANCFINNSGIPITAPIAITTDITAASRNAATPDMGAYELNFTAFVVTAGSNSPVCAGSAINFTSDPGTALNPTYSWTNPANTIISTLQNPSVAVTASGTYTIKVTDASGCNNTATTIVTTNTKPTVRLSGPGFVCGGSTATLTLVVTGNSPINGTLNSGESFGPIAASTITINVTPFVNTNYYITSLSDNSCTSIATDYPDTAKIRVTQNGDWTGAISTIWSDAGNWCGGIPASSADITVAAGLPFYPVIKSLAALHNITVASGASLTDSSTLQIAGTITNAGTFNVSAGTLEMNGASTQTIPANAFVNNNINKLIISNNVTLAGMQNITGSLAFGSSGKTLTTGGLLTLKSTATGTATLADITNAGANSGNSISGAVTIERFILAKRAWRLLAAPVSANGAPTINASWQEGATTGNPSPGYGVELTGGSVANGYDQGINLNPSVKYYNSTTNALTGIPSSPGTNVSIATYPAYFLFIRGDRSTPLMQGVSAAISPTTLRINGQPNTGNMVTNVAAAGFTLVPNPYPAAINFHTLTKTNVNDKVYLWDPRLGGSSGFGGYVTFSWNGAGYDATTTSSQLTQYIASGAAFFVESQDGTNPGTLTIKETDKATGGNDAVFRPMGTNSKLRVNMLGADTANTLSVLDGVLTTYNDQSDNVVDRNDSKKLYGLAESMAITRQGTSLAIERRHTIDGNDTTFLNVYNLKKQTYTLQLTTEALGSSGLYAVLKDNYSSATNNTPLNMEGLTDINFTVNSDAASFATNRFSIVFGGGAPLPVTFTSVKAYPVQKDISVDWTTATEINVKEYAVQSSLTGNAFTTATTLPAKVNNGGGAAYAWLDKNAAAGLHYYRIKETDFNGKENYSQVVKVTIDKSTAGPSIAVYGSSVQGNTVTVQFTNIATGPYTLQLYSVDGKLLKNVMVQHTSGGGNLTHSFTVENYLPAGRYQLQLSGKTMQLNTSFIKE